MVVPGSSPVKKLCSSGRRPDDRPEDERPPGTVEGAADQAPIGDLSQSMATAWFVLASLTATASVTPGATAASFASGTR